MSISWEDYHAILEDITKYGSACMNHGIALGRAGHSLTSCHEADRDAQFKAICEKLAKLVVKGGKYGVSR